MEPAKAEDLQAAAAAWSRERAGTPPVATETSPRLRFLTAVRPRPSHPLSETPPSSLACRTGVASEAAGFPPHSLTPDIGAVFSPSPADFTGPDQNFDGHGPIPQRAKMGRATGPGLGWVGGVGSPPSSMHWAPGERGSSPGRVALGSSGGPHSADTAIDRGVPLFLPPAHPRADGRALWSDPVPPSCLPKNLNTPAAGYALRSR